MKCVNNCDECTKSTCDTDITRVRKISKMNLLDSSSISEWYIARDENGEYVGTAILYTSKEVVSFNQKSLNACIVGLFIELGCSIELYDTHKERNRLRYLDVINEEPTLCLRPQEKNSKDQGFTVKETK